MHVQVHLAAHGQVAIDVLPVSEAVEGEGDDAVRRVLNGNHPVWRIAGLHGVKDVLNGRHGDVVIVFFRKARSCSLFLDV